MTLRVARKLAKQAIKQGPTLMEIIDASSWHRVTPDGLVRFFDPPLPFCVRRVLDAGHRLWISGRRRRGRDAALLERLRASIAEHDQRMAARALANQRITWGGDEPPPLPVTPTPRRIPFSACQLTVEIDGRPVVVIGPPGGTP